MGSPGTIETVAINNSGVGIIGGSDGTDFYAAFTDGSVLQIPLIFDPVQGFVNSVAIDDTGVALIGGQTGDSEGYLAVAAPDGTVTRLSTPGVLGINSVAFGGVPYVPPPGPSPTPSFSTPRVGPYGSAVYSHLAASAALENRLIQQNRVWKSSRGTSQVAAQISENSDFLVAYNELNPSEEGLLAISPQQQATPRKTGAPLKPNSLWVEPFGNLVYLKQEGSIPSYSNEIGGVLLGYDRQGENYIFGVTAGYSFNYVDYSQSLGHAKVQEEMGSLYGSYYSDHFWIALAFWGGWYQVDNTRYSFGEIISKGKAHGWIVDPHLEIASPWALDQNGYYYIEPFAQFDWVNNWQHGFTETGASGLNLVMPNIYNSLLQSEIGLRFYERFVFGWGDFCMEEKVSYMNQAPFSVNSERVAFVSSASTFPVAVASSTVQNLGAAQIMACFVPKNTSLPYGGFSFQGTANSSYQSYFVSLFSGIDF